MDGFSITAERISAAGAGVAEVAASLATEIAAMQGMLDEVRAGWQSTQAAPRFAVALQTHLERATAIKDALLSHGTTLVGTGRRYAEAEASLAETIPGGPR